MDYQKVAQNIVRLVGGEENVAGVTHCVTRLRFRLVDEAKADTNALKSAEGVMGVVQQGGQYQVIIGPEVESVYNEVTPLVGGGQGEVAADEAPAKPQGIKGWATAALDTLIACFVPSISIIAGAGMVKVLAVLLSSAGVLPMDSASYTVLNMIGDSVFHFLPFLVAFNAARKMDVDVMASMALAAVILHPTLLTLGETGTSVNVFGFGMQILDYSAQALPVIFGVLLLKYVDRFADRVSPNIVKVFLRPMIDLLVVAPVMLFLIGPASSVLGAGFLAFCELCNQWGWLAVGVNAALFPLMVLTGTHNATIPLLVQMFATQGFDSVFLPSGMAANIAEAGAAGAVALKTKNKTLRATALSATVSACLGITEPALYGVNLRLKKPFIAVLLGAAIGGCIMGLVKITAPTFVSPSVITLPVFLGQCPNILLGIMSVPLTYIITFVIAYLFGFEDVEDAEAQKDAA